DALMKARWGFFVRQPLGILVNAMSVEAVNASQVFSHGSRLAAVVIQFVVFVGLSFLVSWQVALTSMVLGLVMVMSLSALVRITRKVGCALPSLMRSSAAQCAIAATSNKQRYAMELEVGLQPLIEPETRSLNQTHDRKERSRAYGAPLQEPIAGVFMAALV